MHSVVIHQYHGSLTAIEFGESGSAPENFVVFVGGLTDGFLTVPYLPDLAKSVRKHFSGKWVVVQALLSSSYLGFGISSVRQDAVEISKLVKYLRTKRGSVRSKVVLMGHSTGCQDAMEYLSKLSTEQDFDVECAIDGAILQAPVSDVEACEFLDEDKQLPPLLSVAEDLIRQGKPNELLPVSCFDLTFGAPATAYRFHSLYTHKGDDDYFSSTLTDADLAKTFGRVTRPLLVLHGSKDSAIPPWVDLRTEMERWQQHTGRHWSGQSKIIEGANHNISDGSDERAVATAVASVISFLQEDVGASVGTESKTKI